MSNFGHIGLNVSDVSRSQQFYQQVFGFDVIKESTDANQRFVLLGEDGKAVVTLWQQSTGTFKKDTPGLHHLAFWVDDIDAVEHLEQRLRDMKVNFLYDGVVAHSEGAKSGGIFFEDPDGIRLEIFSPDSGEHHEAPESGAACGLF
ncbi:MAG: VOC family protein [Anaerolineaceae bacterium]|nr:VOC family protein [Anaerolineaceae bacterium]